MNIILAYFFMWMRNTLWGIDKNRCIHPPLDIDGMYEEHLLKLGSADNNIQI